MTAEQVANEFIRRYDFFDRDPHSFYSDVLNEDLESPESPEQVAEMFDLIAGRLHALANSYSGSAKEARR